MVPSNSSRIHGKCQLDMTRKPKHETKKKTPLGSITQAKVGWVAFSEKSWSRWVVHLDDTDLSSQTIRSTIEGDIFYELSHQPLTHCFTGQIVHNWRCRQSFEPLFLPCVSVEKNESDAYAVCRWWWHKLQVKAGCSRLSFRSIRVYMVHRCSFQADLDQQ